MIDTVITPLVVGHDRPPTAPEQLRFIDLFAGVGGFHLALRRLGHRCVFASELDPDLRALYKDNFGMEAEGDIKRIRTANIPPHDILCAGFPCQPFSKAGEQNGLEDPRWGKLFYHILKVVKSHRPRYLILENVPNLARHNKMRTWKEVESLLRKEQYDIRIENLSPHQYGIPQIRERIFIVGKLGSRSLEGFEWPKKTHNSTDVRTVLDENPVGARRLSEQALASIAMWQEFLDSCPKEVELPSFPIWTMEFGATYPYEETTPFAIGVSQLRRYRGAHGQPLEELNGDALFHALPSYARTQKERFPHWKVLYIRQNRAFYEQNRIWIDPWRPQLLRFPASHQKFEWNAKGEERNLKRLVLQFRASGVRAKRPTTAPSLVAMTTTQVPIVTWEERYMTTRECARLQCMEDLKLPDAPTRAYEVLGNAVNVHVVELVAAALLSHNPDAVDIQSSLIGDDPEADVVAGNGHGLPQTNAVDEDAHAATLA